MIVQYYWTRRVACNLIVCYTVGVNLIKQTMIEGFVLTFALMSFCIGSSFAIVNFASKGRFF